MKELKPVVESTAEYEKIERQIIYVFRDLLYRPLLRALRYPTRKLQNAVMNPLWRAIAEGEVWVETGRQYKTQKTYVAFHGKFSAAVSKELKAAGAKWHAGTSSFRIPSADVVPEFYAAIQDATAKAMQKFRRAAETLAQKLPEEITASVKATSYFDAALLKVDAAVKATVKDIAVAPKLTETTRQRIAAEWQDNLEKHIKDFADEEVTKLREMIRASALSGNRFEASIAAIKESFGVTERKAKFLARQETGLLVAKFKESRYTESGIHEYRWRCAAGSARHPVRPSHKALDGKVFRWDTPPITTSSGEPARRNNPGEDFNCRCVAIPIVRF